MGRKNMSKIPVVPPLSPEQLSLFFNYITTMWYNEEKKKHTHMGPMSIELAHKAPGLVAECIGWKRKILTN